MSTFQVESYFCVCVLRYLFFSALQCTLGENTLVLLLCTLFIVNECVLFKLVKIESQLGKVEVLGLLFGNTQANISQTSYLYEMPL